MDRHRHTFVSYVDRGGSRWARVFRRRVLAVVLFTAFSIVADALPAAARDSVLMIGNSFTAGLRPRLRALVRSAGRDVFVAARAVDGWTLAHHAASGSTRHKLEAKPWTTVVLQEQSRGMFDERFDSARALDAAIPNQTVFFMTWRDQDEEIEWYDYNLGEPGGTHGYVPIAYELDAAIAPVGWVFREIILQEGNPALWASDGHHASERGRYIAVLTLYAAIFGESPVGLWFPRSLSVDQAFADQLLVESIVLCTPSFWNIDVAPLDCLGE